MPDHVITAQGLVTRVVTDQGAMQVVDRVSLSVARGEIVALVGESGCGKSMTALSLMRLVRKPAEISAGRVLFDGQDLLALSEPEMRGLRGGRLSMVFQDPMTFLNPLMRIGDQIAEAIILHQKRSRREAREAALAVLKQVKMPSPESVLEDYPHHLSGGMRQRVLIAMAVSSRPHLLIADEPTTALDVTVQAQIMALLTGLVRELGSGMLLITHDLGLVAEYCDRVYVMYAGQIVEEAAVADIFARPQHPYTQALLRSTLPPDRRLPEFETLPGQPPSPMHFPAGCRFHPRCGHVVERCRTQMPEGQVNRCWLGAGRTS